MYHTVILYDASGKEVDRYDTLPQGLASHTFTLSSVSPSTAKVTVNGTSAQKGYSAKFYNGEKITVVATADGYKSSTEEYTMGMEDISAGVSLEKEFIQVGVSYDDTIGPEGGTVDIDIDTADCTSTTTYTITCSTSGATLSQRGLEGWSIDITPFDGLRIITFTVTTTDGDKSASTDYTITQD